MEPLISIIVPVYNASQFLPQCLNSILNQTYPNIEVICIDDGSTDDSSTILKKFQQDDSRIVLISQKNHGISYTRSIGLKAANGDYIMFVDSDDWIEPSTCADAIYTSETTNADIVFWSYLREYPDKSLPRKVCTTPYFSFDENACADLRRMLIGPCGQELSHPENLDSFSTLWGKLYRHNCICRANARFIDLAQIGTSEDTFFNIQVFRHIRRAEYIDKYNYHYRKNHTSCTAVYKPELWTQWNRLYDLINIEIDTVPLHQALSNRIALNLIGLGFNIASSKLPFPTQCAEIKKILQSTRYHSAVSQLEISTMPPHWKIFFTFAKYKISWGVVILCHTAQFLKSRV